MDTSGNPINTTPTSPFAPVDIPDINNISTPSAMPPMGMQMGASESAPVAQPNPVEAQPVAPNPAIPSADSVNSAEIKMTDIPEPKIAAEVPAEKPAEKPSVIPNQVPQAASAKPAEAKSAPEAEAKPVAKPAEAPKTGAKVEAKAGAKPSGKAETKPEIKTEDKTATKPEIEIPTGTPANGLTIEMLLEECLRQNASDLHLQVGLPPILRVDGALRPLTTYPVLDEITVQQLVLSTLDANQKVILMKDKEFDYSFAFGDLARFRVNAFYEKGNMAAAFRLVPNAIKTIDELGLPAVVATFADHPNGLVLVTGPTGSGKSTTLAALVDKINTEKSTHIITIEDPIEFTHHSKRSVVAQREVHYDTYSFAAALRSILREDPDVVLIGEMRDLETIQAAITVAETGHLVFATLHTNSAAQSIDRMIDVFPAHQQPQVRAQLANILVGICSQRLIPAINGGRVVVTEIMITNSAVRSIIREGKTHQLDMTIQTGMSQGMQTMDRELAKFVKSGIIAYDVAREYAVDQVEFDRLARG